jgi:hypothetical protein
MSDPNPECDSAAFSPSRSDRSSLSRDDTWSYFLPDDGSKQHYTTRLAPPVAAEVEAFRERYDLSKADAIAMLVQLGLGHTSTVARLDRLATTTSRTTDRYDQLATSVTRLERELEAIADTLDELQEPGEPSSATGTEADPQSGSGATGDTTADGTADDPDELF